MGLTPNSDFQLRPNEDPGDRWRDHGETTRQGKINFIAKGLLAKMWLRCGYSSQQKVENPNDIATISYQEERRYFKNTI
jgi:hypothetical protein